MFCYIIHCYKRKNHILAVIKFTLLLLFKKGATLLAQKIPVNGEISKCHYIY